MMAVVHLSAHLVMKTLFGRLVCRLVQSQVLRTKPLALILCNPAFRVDARGDINVIISLADLCADLFKAGGSPATMPGVSASIINITEARGVLAKVYESCMVAPPPPPFLLAENQVFGLYSLPSVQQVSRRCLRRSFALLTDALTSSVPNLHDRVVLRKVRPVAATR